MGHHVERAFADLGRIDVVVNNAGYAIAGAAEELTDEQVVHQLKHEFLSRSAAATRIPAYDVSQALRCAE
jgi:NAD(P)-dependent dehydrogenase (short-subunit alcohol dehydrogenase family)